MASNIGALRSLNNTHSKNVEVSDDKALHSVVRNNSREEVKLLLEKGVDINATGSNGKTLLHIACQFSNTEIIKALLENGASLDIKDNLNLTALFYAVLSDNAEVLKLLDSFGVDFDEKIGFVDDEAQYFSVVTTKDFNNETVTIGVPCSNSGNDLLHFAAANGKSNAIKFLVSDKDFDINCKDSNGYTPLTFACLEDDIDSMKLLIELGADINVRDSDGDSLLHIALDSDDLDVVKYLLSNADFDINYKDNEGETPLGKALSYGNLDAAKILLKHGADINYVNENNMSMIFPAVSSGKLDILKFVLEHMEQKNIDINSPVISSKGNCATITPLMFALYTLNQSDASEGEMLELLNFMFDNGAKVSNAKFAEGGATVMHALFKCEYAYEDYSEAVINFIISKGGDINSMDDFGETPLHYAIRSNIPNLVKLAIEKGADINLADQSNLTPLYYALYNENLDIAELLVNNGADINLADQSNLTPLYYALYNENLDIAELLVNNGANIDINTDDLSYDAKEYLQHKADEILKKNIDSITPTDDITLTDEESTLVDTDASNISDSIDSSNVMENSPFNDAEELGQQDIADNFSD